MREFKSIMKSVRYHGKILLKGFRNMLFGTATAGLIVLAGYGFYVVPGEGGYAAVCDFILAAATLSVAVSSMYVMGGNKKGAKK